jgi:antirestriction protein ArdC
LNVTTQSGVADTGNALDEGVVPWKQPWSLDPNCGRPLNGDTKRPYNGINVLLLALHNHSFRFDSRYFGTYRQWQSMGGQVMARPAAVPKGKWGCQIILFKPITKTKTNRNGDEVEDKFCMMKQFCVFNIEQVEGDHLDHLRAGYADSFTDPAVSIQEADELIANSGIDIMHGGNKAFYDPTIDIIQVPHRHQFDGASYYETLFHEMAHACEHRLNMQRGDDPNSYAKFELVAEMASCFLCSELGIPFAEGLENHAAYVGGWAKKIRDAVETDASFILKASTLASKVTDYLLSFRTATVEEREPAIIV